MFFGFQLTCGLMLVFYGYSVMKNPRVWMRVMWLYVIFGFMTVLCIFSIVMMAVLFVRNEWSNHKDKNDNVRVEKVYQQYTKADLCYFDDDGRKIMNTVWLDVPGIRDGDYIQCYTGNDNSGLFLNYSLSTLIFVAVFVIVMIILLILTGSEMQRIKKEEILQIILEDEKADEEI